MKYPRVVAIIPAFNSGRLVIEAVESLMDHPADMRVILCNDKSTDNTPRLLEGIKQRYPGQVYILHNEINIGVSQSRNRMLDFLRSGDPFVSELKDSDYLLFLDHDDLSIPSRISSQVAYLDAHPECKLVGGQFIMFGPGLDDSVSKMPCGCEEVKVYSLFETVNLPSTYMSRIGDTQHPDFRFSNTYYAEDWEFMLRNYSWLNYNNVPDPVCRYRRHGSNVTSNIKDSMASVGTNIRREFLKKALLVEPTVDEMKIHITLSPCKFWKPEVQAWLWRNKETIVVRGRAWLDKLSHQNKLTGFSDADIFDSEVNKILDSVKLAIRGQPPSEFLFDLE